ncbi:MAG: DUF5615 family PIN-like protein [Acidimicrobiales bacterium]
MKLALDHHYSTAIAKELRRRGHDVVSALERGWEMEEDEALLMACEAEQRTLLTNNVADFTVIARHWAAEGLRHAGLVFTSNGALPRGRSTIGTYVELLDDLLRSNQKDEAFVDRVHWLTDQRSQRE